MSGENVARVEHDITRSFFILPQEGVHFDSKVPLKPVEDFYILVVI